MSQYNKHYLSIPEEEIARRRRIIAMGLERDKTYREIAIECGFGGVNPQGGLRSFCERYNIELPRRNVRDAGRATHFTVNEERVKTFFPYAQKRGITVRTLVKDIMSVLEDEPSLIDSILDDGK